MAMEFLHVGVPVTNKKEGMTYSDGLKLWMTNPDDCEYKMEYLKFEEGTPFPEIMHKNPHIAYKVDDMQKYLDEAQCILVKPMDLGDGVSIAFIVKDDTIIELYHKA